MGIYREDGGQAQPNQNKVHHGLCNRGGSSARIASDDIAVRKATGCATVGGCVLAMGAG